MIGHCESAMVCSAFFEVKMMGEKKLFNRFTGKTLKKAKDLKQYKKPFIEEYIYFILGIFAALVDGVTLLILGILLINTLMNKSIDLSFILGLISATITLVAAVISSINLLKRQKKEIDGIREYNNNSEKRSYIYGFEYQYELSQYRNIGKKNYYLKYSDWAAHMSDRYRHRIGDDDFYRYLNGIYIELKISEQIGYSCVIPLVIGFAGIMTSAFSTNTNMNYQKVILFSMLFLLILTVIIVPRDKRRIGNEMRFIEDVEQVLELGTFGNK